MAWRLAAKQRTSYIQNRVVKAGSWCQLRVFLIEKKNSHESFSLDPRYLISMKLKISDHFSFSSPWFPYSEVLSRD